MKAIFSVNFDVQVDKSKDYLGGNNSSLVYSEKGAEDAVRKARTHWMGRVAAVPAPTPENPNATRDGTVTGFMLLGVSLAARAQVE